MSMFLKLLFRVLFEKKRIIVAYVMVCMILVVYVSLQTMFESKSISSLSTTPDFVFTGTVYNSEDGSYPFRAYNGIGEFESAAKDIVGERGKCFGVVCRSLYNYYDELTSVGFSGYVYGLPNEYMEELFSNALIDGTLPKPDSKEGVVGYYFAQRFELGVGDLIPQAITLGTEWEESDINSYTISGVLDEGVSSYFNGSVMISREEFERNNHVVEDNMLLGSYNKTNEGEAVNSSFVELNAISSQFRSPEGRLNYNQKHYQFSGTLLHIAVYIVISTLILFLLMTYIIKGMTPKIGLLKAIGMSDAKIYKTFLGGMTLITVGAVSLGILVSLGVSAIMNSYVCDFYGFTVNEYSFNSIVYVIIAAETLIMLLSVFAFLFICCRRISPKIAMTKS